MNRNDPTSTGLASSLLQASPPAPSAFVTSLAVDQPDPAAPSSSALAPKRKRRRHRRGQAPGAAAPVLAAAEPTTAAEHRAIAQHHFELAARVDAAAVAVRAGVAALASQLIAAPPPASDSPPATPTPTSQPAASLQTFPPRPASVCPASAAPHPRPARAAGDSADPTAPLGPLALASPPASRVVGAGGASPVRDWPPHTSPLLYCPLRPSYAHTPLVDPPPRFHDALPPDDATPPSPRAATPEGVLSGLGLDSPELDLVEVSPSTRSPLIPDRVAPPALAPPPSGALSGPFHQDGILATPPRPAGSPTLRLGAGSSSGAPRNPTQGPATRGRSFSNGHTDPVRTGRSLLDRQSLRAPRRSATPPSSRRVLVSRLPLPDPTTLALAVESAASQPGPRTTPSPSGSASSMDLASPPNLGSLSPSPSCDESRDASPRAPLRPWISLPRPPGPMPHRRRLPSLPVIRPARS